MLNSEQRAIGGRKCNGRKQSQRHEHKARGAASSRLADFLHASDNWWLILLFSLDADSNVNPHNKNFSGISYSVDETFDMPIILLARCEADK